MLKDLIKKILKEATSEIGSRGSYIPPLQPGLRPFEKNSLAPFNQSVSDFKNPLVQYDSYDKKMDLRIDQIKELEKQAKKVQDYMKHHPYSTFSDEDGNIINQFDSKTKTPDFKEKNTPFINKIPVNEWTEITDELLKEADTTTTAGLYNGPIEIGLKKWKNQLAPFTEDAEHLHNHRARKSKLKDNVERVVGVWEKNKDGSYHNPTHDAGGKKEKQINEDLAVWFGTKKKPKGSKQPKGPWVNICRKKEGGGHPPCGRPEASSKGYPKCRAAGVASKMTDSQKKAACAQKRRAEKTNPKLGTGNKPKMVSYKPKKKKTNESRLDSLIKNLIRGL